MADQPTTPPVPPGWEAALNTRRANRQGLDGNSSDSDLIRVINGERIKRGEEQSGDVNLRGDGRRRSRTPQKGSPKGDRELPIPPAPLPNNPFTASSNILQDIAARFNAARELQKAGAWKQLQTDLMNASPFICPNLIPYKDLIQIVADIEKEIKGTSSSQTGKSNEQLLADFLNGGPDLGSIPPPPPPNELDIPS